MSHYKSALQSVQIGISVE